MSKGASKNLCPARTRRLRRAHISGNCAGSAQIRCVKKITPLTTFSTPSQLAEAVAISALYGGKSIGIRDRSSKKSPQIKHLFHCR
jgi:hypothetical protein